MHASRLPRPSAAVFDLTRPAGPLRRAITERYRISEPIAVGQLAPLAAFDAAASERIRSRAQALVERVRARRWREFGVDALVNEFDLSRPEGVALMCLAEALLRIPDAATADQLIEERLAGRDWLGHVCASRPLVSAASIGLASAAGLFRCEAALPSALGRPLRGLTRPIVRRAVRWAIGKLGSRFVRGETIDEAMSGGRANEARGYRHSYDMLGEAATTMEDAERYFDAYVEAIHAIGRNGTGATVYERPGISVKLSALHSRYGPQHYEQLVRELLPRMKELMRLCKEYDIGLSVDAEESDRLELFLDLFEPLVLDPDLAGWDGMGVVAQASLKRCPAVLEWLFALAGRARRRLMVRLVKGAYWDTELKRSQVEGATDYPVYTRKAHTDIAYLACARMLLAHPDAIYPQFATHNALTLMQVLEMAGANGDLEFQCLHGMGQAFYDQVVGREGWRVACRIYAPVGTHETLLAYLVRRILENGANSSFVRQVADPNVSFGELLADPVEHAKPFGGAPHLLVPLPRDMFPERRNSEGMDFSDAIALEALSEELRAAASQSMRATPILDADDMHVSVRATPVRSPTDIDVVVGEAIEADTDVVEQALRAAHNVSGWPLEPHARARSLLATADLLERHRGRFVYLAVREAGKTMANAIGEVREAVDYCRYYATRVAAEDPGQPLGTIACISPWNFPLAIFVGQVAAALAAGNRVIAKPAEQTPLVAAEVVRLFHKAGIPKAALQFLPGTGEVVGAALVRDARVDGVMFTGSLEVAQAIHRTLAARGNVPLIAETGGQNVMIVDSSALPEQVIPDVLASAFDSAGQRCSALRVLLVQREVADRYVHMLRGAIRELVVGDPARLETDVGPIIDAEARRRLEDHIARLEGEGRLIARAPFAGHERGHFVPPVAFEIESLDQLEGEVFGPVLHLLRYDAAALDSVVDQVNALGYGLTLGLHTRLGSRIERVAARARVGNVYVNRNMIGAVVGVQPFGGEGLSGTGPKAGGPLTLAALVRRDEVRDDGLRIAAESLGEDARLQGEVVSPEKIDGSELLKALAHHTDPAIAQMADWYLARLATLQERELPGPTGERNRWTTAPRGLVVAIGDAKEDAIGWLGQALAAIATENPVIFVATAEDTAAQRVASFIARHGGPVIEVCVDASGSWAELPELAVVLCGDVKQAAAAAARVAQRDGRRIPVVEPTSRRWCYAPWRLRVERTISENTTAFGGNAVLLAKVS